MNPRSIVNQDERQIDRTMINAGTINVTQNLAGPKNFCFQY